VTRTLRDEMPPAMAGIEIQSERTAGLGRGRGREDGADGDGRNAAAERVAETRRA
jgi:hypothetical protein